MDDESWPEHWFDRIYGRWPFYLGLALVGALAILGSEHWWAILLACIVGMVLLLGPAALQIASTFRRDELPPE